MKFKNTKTYLYPHVRSIIFNTQDTKTSQESTDRQMDKDNVASMHNGVVFSPRKKEILPSVTTWTDLKDLTLSELSDRKRQILCDLAHMENLIKKKKKKQNS